jgi:hypothetical protein
MILKLSHLSFPVGSFIVKLCVPKHTWTHTEEAIHLIAPFIYKKWKDRFNTPARTITIIWKICSCQFSLTKSLFDTCGDQVENFMCWFSLFMGHISFSFFTDPSKVKLDMDLFKMWSKTLNLSNIWRQKLK